MSEKSTLEELRQHLAEVVDEIKQTDQEYDGLPFTAESRAKFDALRDEKTRCEAEISEREMRQQYIASLTDSADHVEAEPRYDFQVRKPASLVPDDPTRFEEYRLRARSLDDLEQGYRDGARKILETRYRVQHPHVSKEEAQNDIDYLVELDNEVAVRMIATSSAGYRREFGQYVSKGLVGPEMARAATIVTGGGGYAIPVELDTTLFLTSAGVVNPIRRLARVRQTNVNVINFINTNGIVAGFGAEAAAATDNAPTLAQPVVNIEKAFAFVPMSIEVAEDWANIQADMAMAFADAKATLESTKFLTGLGHSSNEPQGLIASGGATAVVTSATTAVFAVADLYSLQQALSPRYRPNAVFAGNLAAANKIRQFDTAGGANLWTQLSFDLPANLLGRPFYEWSDVSSAVTTSASTVLIWGDFNYFGIVDRVGLNVEFIQHLFATANNRPSGQRGLYAYWRTSSQVLAPTLQANSAFVSLKLL